MAEFASRNETSKREPQLEVFISQVLGLPWALITDESRLSDFEGVRTELELSEACTATYGMGLEQRHFSVPLWQLLDELNANLLN